jgi:pimeloyl-ACP methyl ester carboxylesterase
MFTDIVGYTAVVGRDEAKGLALRERHRRIVQTLAAQFHGEWLDETGDDSLSSFPSAVDAVNCALALQGALARDAELTIRIGIHVGDVVERDGRLYGDGINVASRLPAQAPPGGICVSRRVRDEVRNQAGIVARRLGERRLKNVAEPVEVFAVSQERAEAPARRRRRVLSFGRAALLATLVLVGVAFWRLGDDVVGSLLLAGIRQGILPAGPDFEQEIAFATSSDGVRIAYGTVGEGPPVVIVLGWFTHLERGVLSPGLNAFLPALVDRHRVVQYDGRGAGLSDRDVEDYSLEARVRDLEAVVDAAGLERFAIYAISAGGQAAVAYAVKHPERVTRIAFFGSFLRLDVVPGQMEQWQSFVPMVRVGWGNDNPAFRQLFTSLFMPDASELDMRIFNEAQRVAATPRDASDFIAAMIGTDVSRLARRVRAPVLVVHLGGDAIVPFECGREIAALVPGARLVGISGNNHALMPGDAAYGEVATTAAEFFAEDL